jgi:hypothetical protein
MMKYRLTTHFLSILFSLVIAPHAYSGDLPNDQITIAVPGPVLSMLVSSALPLRINCNDAVVGDIWIESIRDLRFSKNTVLCSLRLRGKDVKYTVMLSKTPVIIEAGDMDLSFNVEGLFRFDSAANTLFVKPIIVDNTENAGQNGTLVSVLSQLSGIEYPIQVGSLNPIIFALQDKTLQCNFFLKNVFSKKDGLFLTISPKLAKKVS